MTCRAFISLFFFFNDTATTEIYTLSLHDALPIYFFQFGARVGAMGAELVEQGDVCAGNMTDVRQQPGNDSIVGRRPGEDRKSTRLNSSHGYISYAVFCLKKKKNTYSVSVSAITAI